MRSSAFRSDVLAALALPPRVHPLPPGALLAVALVLGACGSSPPNQVATRDSAGVTITRSETPVWAPGAEWRVAATPTMVTGGLAGQSNYEFTNVVDARRLPDGHVLATQCSPPQVRLYGPSGEFVRAFGGLGVAPGRCQFILHSWLAGTDTLLVYDPTLGRVTRFGLGGELIGVDDVGAASDEGGFVWVDRFADGSLLGRPNSPPPSVNGRSRASFAYVRRDPSTGAIDTLLTAAGAEYVAEGIGTPEARTEQVLFSPFTSAIALDSTMLVADTRDFWIEEWTRDGRLLRRFGRAYEPRSIDRDFIRAYTQQRLAAAGSRARDVRVELARAVFADAFPAHEGTILVDPSGNVWVLDYPGAADQTRAWSVFDPDGRWLGDVQLPRELRVTDVGTDYLLGVWRDADGTQTVRAYALDRSPSPVAAGS